jgi:hypothetical protein
MVVALFVISLGNKLPSRPFKDKRYKLCLNIFQTVHETSLIANFTVYLTSTSLIGEFTRSMVDFTSTKEKVTINLVEGPINFTPTQQKRSIIKMISTFLYRNNIQLRNPTPNSAPIMALSVAEYNKFYKDFKKYKIDSITDLKSTGLEQTLEFTTFCNAKQNELVYFST